MAMPALIGGYRIVDELGHGGMGTVYLAEKGGRRAAVKVLRDSFDHPSAKPRFKREIDAGLELSGEGVAELYEADADADPPWMAFEYIDGPTLDHHITTGDPMPADAAAVLGMRLTSALARIHGKDLAHRDLHPKNIMIAPEGPKIIDFGLATFVDQSREGDGTKLTGIGVRIGVDDWMAPEQYRGDNRYPRPGDVYSLGATLSFAATGTRSTVRSPPPLDEVDPNLRRVLAAMTAEDPLERPTADAAYEQFKALATEGGDLATAVKRMERHLSGGDEQRKATPAGGVEPSREKAEAAAAKVREAYAKKAKPW
jgi:serine/threonine protein kinase